MTQETLALAHNFAVQVYCSAGGDTGKFGSGFYIAPGLILTAAHTLAAQGASRGAPLQDTARICLQATRNDRWRDGIGATELGWVSATRVWPTSPRAAREDVVILQVDDPDFADPDVFANANWRLSLDRLEHEYPEVDFYGYPSYSHKFSEVYQNRHPFRAYGGDLQAYDRANDALLALSPRCVTPNSAAGWRALSGAAVLRGGEVIGLIKAASVSSADNRELQVQRLDSLRRNRAFREIMAPALATKKPPRPRDLSGIVRPEMVDRGTEVAAFGLSLMQMRAENPDRHLVFVQEGHERDDLANCIYRYCEGTAQQVLGLSPEQLRSYSNPIILNLASPGKGAKPRLITALTAWAKRVDTQTPGFCMPDEAKDRIRANALKPDVSRLLVLQHDGADFSQECTSVIEGVLETLASLPPADPPLLVFLKICTGDDSTPDHMPVSKVPFADKREHLKLFLVPKLQDWLEKAQGGAPPPSERIALTICDPPGDCERADVESWISDIAATSRLIVVDDIPPGQALTQLIQHSAIPQRTTIDCLKQLEWKEATE